MKKTLRMLCMGVMAAFSAVSFAQTNVTDKVLNPGAENRMLGWDVTYLDGGDIWNTQTKGEEKAVGYHGYNNLAFECWRNSNAGLTNGSIFQVVRDLPNGTYVFGAYATATRDSWAPSIDDIEGVYLFANEHTIPVATHRVEGMTERWAHAIKFNVATTVTDGTIKFGMKTENSYASFVTMDNVTLYYFGDKDYQTALEEMAKIDMDATIAKVDTFLKYKMNVDTIAFINAAIEAAAGVTAETAAQIDEDLWWGKRQAVMSIAQYEALAKAIASAKEIAAKEWSDYETTVASLATLNSLIKEAEGMYDEAIAEKFELATWVDSLGEAAALVELDSLYILLDVYTEKIDAMVVGEEIGEYLDTQKEIAEANWENAGEALYEAEEGIITAVEAKQLCEEYFRKIDQIIASPIDYAEFPIIIPRSKTPLPNQSKENMCGLEGSYVASYNGRDNVPSYKSKLYRFREPLTKVRFIVRENCGNDFGLKGDKPVTCWGTFRMYDENGDQIPLTEDMIRTNADHNTLCSSKDGVGIPGMLDDNVATYFHTAWDYAVPEYHYVEVTLPEGEYSAFSFFITSIRNSNTQSFPAVMEITYVSESITELQQAVLDATIFNPLAGTVPGFYNVDLTAFNTAIAEGQALLEKEAPSESAIQSAIAKIKAEQAKIEEAGIMMPEAGKVYRVVSGEDGFMPNQNVQKALTIHQDSVYGEWLWWETASADSAQQEFILEAMPELGENYYAFKNVKYDLYLGEFFDEDNNRVNNKFVLTEEKSAFLLQHLGYGQFAILREGHDRQWFHLYDHNQGVAAPETATQESNPNAIKGITSSIITWNGGANDPSSFMFRELQKLPFNAKSISDLKFKSESITLYEGINTIVLTADKDCAFENLVITSLAGKVVEPESVKIAGNTATIELTNAIGDIVFSFDNAEGVTEVTLNGTFTYRGVSAAYTALQNTYNTVLALNPVEGTEVGQVADLTAYNDALAIAEGLLEEGGEDAALEAAKATLEAAKAGLVYNLPKADTDYLILIGIDAIRTNHHTDMAIYTDFGNAQGDVLRWTYVSLTNDAYRWRFIDCGELKYGRPAYYIQSVVSNGYVARTIESNGSVFLVEDSTATRPYDLFFLTGGKVAITDTYWSNGEAAIHPNYHGGGASGYKGNKVITWGRTDNASAMRIVEAEKYITDVVYSINGIENIDVTDEFVAPAVKGTFDLFGRRIDTPATTGIYIIDGKKRIIKK